MASTEVEGEVLIRRAEIEKRVRSVARQITRDFKGERVHLIGVLKGACIFLSDLVREINLESSIDFIAVSSYGRGKESSGQVRVLKDLDSSIAGLNVILVEDILDTGLTLSYLLRVLRQRRPKTLRVAALLDKPSRRLKPVEANYIGFKIPERVRRRLRPRLRRALPQPEGRVRPSSPRRRNALTGCSRSPE